MGFISDAIGSVFGGITGASQSAKGVERAANIQASAADRAMAEQRAARESSQAFQRPYVDAGSKAISQQMALLGLNGTAGQQDAMNALLASPEYTTSVRQGEEAILQNASATGGLRGGNTQNSLAGFRADLLNQLFNNQFQRLGGITSIGQNAAAGSGNSGMVAAAGIGDLIQQQGANLGGAQIARGNVVSDTFSRAAQTAGTVLGAMKGF